MVALELALRNAPGAAAQLAKLEAPPEELVQEVTALRAELAEEARARGELARLRRERDLSASETVPSGAFILFWSLVGGCALLVDALGVEAGNGALAAFWAGTVGLLTLGSLANRARAFVNEANRTLQVALMTLFGWVLAVSVAGWIFELPAATTFAVVVVVFAVSVAQVAVWGERSMLAYLLGVPAGLLGLWLWPAQLFRGVLFLSLGFAMGACIRYWSRRLKPTQG